MSLWNKRTGVSNIWDLEWTSLTLGWAFTMGEGELSSAYNGWGEFFYEPDWYDGAAAERALTFFYQLALSALSTSIVSGAMAERCNFRSFLIFSAFNVITYAFPAYWIW